MLNAHVSITDLAHPRYSLKVHHALVILQNVSIVYLCSHSCVSDPSF